MGGRRGGEWYGVNGAMGHQRRVLVRAGDLPPARSTVTPPAEELLWRILPWKKDTVTVPDSTLTSLATLGELDLVDRIRKHQ